MTTLLIILIIAASVFLALFVLIQNPKGGGLSAGFAGGSNIMGVKRTSDFLEKGTWALVISLMVFCLAINIVGPSGSAASGGLGDQIQAPASTPSLNLNNTAPATETPAPVQAPADSSN